MDKAGEFLKTAHLYQLGHLDTESPHPATTELSTWVKTDLDKAVHTLATIDVEALAKLAAKSDEIIELRKSIRETWDSGAKVFLIGCGATGRLSLTLENLHREATGREDVVSLMAGGDVALVHSLEGFEDYPAYAVRHLRQLGFKDGDLLIATTEGGETPYVIGGVEEAAKTPRSPYFLYCNPDSVLTGKVERSRLVIENPKIKKINLAVGPMALAGSTRMQASTVLQLAVGLALLTDFDTAGMKQFLSSLTNVHAESSVSFLKPFIEREAREYIEGRYVIYRAFDYGITVFTDTTERAPTFSLTSFSHPEAVKLLAKKPSLCYVQIPQAKTAHEAWRALLGHEPRPLNWIDVDERTSSRYLEAFDFGLGAPTFRHKLTNGAEHSDFEIQRMYDGVEWRFMDHGATILLRDSRREKDSRRDLGGHILFEHTLVKMLLNIHSTLVMGKLGRYEGNLMTYVHPTNGKLIDRATRYARILLARKGKNIPYDDVVRKLFDVYENLASGESVVLKTVECFT